MNPTDLFGYEPPAIGARGDLRVHAKQIGECGVAFTVYYLRRMGFPACEATDTCQYDLTVDVGGRLFRVQVKSTRQSHNGVYRFNHTKGHRSTPAGVRRYDGGDYDILALVALPLEHVVFGTFKDAPNLALPVEMFLREGIEEETFRQVVDILGHKWPMT